MGDLRTQDNALSVFGIDEHRTKVENVVTALAANMDRLQNVDYVLIPAASVIAAGFILEKNPGDTVMPDVNALHFDVVRISAGKLAELARLIQTAGDPVRVTAKTIKQQILAKVASAAIDSRVLSQTLKNDLGIS